MTRRIALGPVETIPADECIAADDDRIVVVRVDDDVCAYRNRCLHQEAPLAGGWVRRGILSCPLHFWRYDVSTGESKTGAGRLERFEVEVVGGEAFVLVPDEPPPLSLREQLLARAAEYDRTTEYRRAIGADDGPEHT